MSQNEHADNDSRAPITDRECLVGTIEHQTGGKQRETVSEGSLLQILSNSVSVDTDVAHDVLAELVNNGEIVIDGDEEAKLRYRLVEGEQ